MKTKVRIVLVGGRACHHGGLKLPLKIRENSIRIVRASSRVKFQRCLAAISSSANPPSLISYKRTCSRLNKLLV